MLVSIRPAYRSALSRGFQARCYRTKKAKSDDPARPLNAALNGEREGASRAAKAGTTKASPVATDVLSASSKHHDDLQSFLRHALDTGLSQRSTFFTGTHYEYTVVESLKRLGFSLTRTAGRGDQGIDLLGHWSVPSSPLPLRVLVQCKALGKAIPPEKVRELEGAFVGAPAGWKGDGVVGFIVATKDATRGVIEAVQRSRWSIGFMQIEKDGGVKQFIWNHQATGSGLQGLGITTRFSESTQEGGAKSLTQEVALMWKGRIVQSGS